MPNDQYQLGELLGQGGMGQVHAARHCSGRIVAVKRVRNTLTTDRLVVDRLSDEARLLRTISHPNVVRALDTAICVVPERPAYDDGVTRVYAQRP